MTAGLPPKFKDLSRDQKIALITAAIDGERVEYFAFDDLWIAVHQRGGTLNFHLNMHYRIVKTPDTIDWALFDPEIEWMARDENGKAYVFDEEPTPLNNYWTSEDSSRIGRIDNIIASYRRGTCDWTDSLVRRSE